VGFHEIHATRSNASFVAASDKFTDGAIIAGYKLINVLFVRALVDGMNLKFS